ncbi:MAG: hypothetical protein HXL01_00380 [Candidatus Nanosynbacter sp.]|nr:hypothetical protein [Candidatus Nanosynbacter sp.]
MTKHSPEPAPEAHSDEIASGVYTVRNLVESDEQKVGAERIVTIVKDRRYDGDEDALFEI